MMTARDFRLAAWEDKKGQWGTLALICFIYCIIFAAIASLNSLNSFSNNIFIILLSAVASIATLVLSGPFVFGQHMAALDVSRRQKVTVSMVFEGFTAFGDSLALFLLNNIFTFLWSLLLIVPGIIKAYAYSMGFFVLADRPDLSANECRKRSMYLMKGHKWQLFCLDFSFIGWYLLSLLTLGILSFWVVPYHMTARAEFYQELLKDEEQRANKAQ